MKTVIVLEAGVRGFAENKDYAKEIRVRQILPALSDKQQVVLDFRSVAYATQSFIHALIGEALNRHGERALEFIEFRKCSEQLRGVIELVVDYSLGGFHTRESGSAQDTTHVDSSEDVDKKVSRGKRRQVS